VRKPKSDPLVIPELQQIDIPEDVLRAICRLEAKRIWRESLEARIDRADYELDKAKEGKP